MRHDFKEISIRGWSIESKKKC